MRRLALGAAVVLGIAVLGAGVAPSTASAFQGESVVINPETGKLTTPAETILTNPTYLEEFEEVAPPAKKRGLLKTLMGSRALPMIGRVLPLVGGAFLANEICNAILSACISFERSGDELDTGSWGGSWQWTNRGATTKGAVAQPMEWKYSVAKGMNGVGGLPSDCQGESALPGGATHYALGNYNANMAWCGEPSGGDPGEYVGGGEYVLPLSSGEGVASVNYAGGVGESHSGSDYCRGWGESDGCQASPDVEGWSAAAADHLQNEADAEVGQWVASKVEGSEVANPFATEVEIPDCAGQAWGACKATLEELELIPERVELDWQTADIELAPDTVTELQPAPQTTVETGTKVTVTTNPPEEGMPLIVVEPLPEETYGEYIERLAPGLAPERIVVSPEFTDPTTGPDGVIDVTPKPGTRADPSTETQVKVRTNPDDAPAPGGGSWTAPSVPAIDITPLTSLQVGCSSFPFGVFCWIAAGLGGWSEGAGDCPKITVPFSDGDLVYDFCTFEPAMEVIRPFILLLSAFGVAWLFGATALGIGGGGEADE